jgi:hypothetical protein
MDSLTLDRIPLQFDLEQICRSLRMKEGSEQEGKLKGLLAEAQSIGKPKAFYRSAFIESRTEDQVVINGIIFTSRILRANLAFGVGQENYGRLYNRFALGADYQYFDPNNPRVEPSPHNSILLIAVTGGLVSVIPYLLFLVSAPLTTWRFFWGTRKLKAGALRAIVATNSLELGIARTSSSALCSPSSSSSFHTQLGEARASSLKSAGVRNERQINTGTSRARAASSGGATPASK